MNALKDDILPTLGLDFLFDYYTQILRDHSQILIGAFYNDELIGFCQLACAPITISSLFKAKPDLLLSICILFFKHPLLFLRGCREAFFMKNTSHNPEIVFIAVEESFRGKGIGELLIRGVACISQKMGFHSIFTKTSDLRVKDMYRTKFNASISSHRSIFKLYWDIEFLTSELMDFVSHSCSI